MTKTRLLSLILLAVAIVLAGYLYLSGQPTNSSWYRPFRLGLDLSGGSRLVYVADTTALVASDIPEALASLREVIERRVNVFGVTEPLVQVEKGFIAGAGGDRLIVELPGVTDVKEAAKLIDATPELDFRATADKTVNTSSIFAPTGLTGRFLQKATVQFSNQSLGPSIGLTFNDQGKKLFAALTRANVGKPLAIYLDGVQISAPVVREEIKDGRAEISGNFSIDEAKKLVRDLNLGALPVPIKLVSTQTIGPTLGEAVWQQGLTAGLIGFLLVAIFMLLWYRLPGLVAVGSLALYASLMLCLFKLFSITITAAGIAGLILSVGIAVDANVLIFERFKEEFHKSEKKIHDSITDGFTRAWLSIRDSNLSSILSALVLFWFGTSFIKGFALTLMIGIIVSLFTAITVTRTFLLAIAPKHKTRLVEWLFGSGF